jgi:hypothetical protein
MIKPTSHYRYFPSISPDQAAAMITDAMIGRPKDVSTPFGRLSTATYATVPSAVDAIANRAYKLFPDSTAAREGGQDGGGAEPAEEAPEEAGTAEQRAFARLTGGTHW